MEVVNDNSCSWVNDLSPRNNIKILSSDLDCEWLIVGAGYTGLSASRKLGQLYPNQKILLVCLLYTSPSPRDRQKSRMPSSA